MMYFDSIDYKLIHNQFDKDVSKDFIENSFLPDCYGKSHRVSRECAKCDVHKECAAKKIENDFADKGYWLYRRSRGK